MHFFFKEIRVRNQQTLPSHGPLILVANHPNTLIDPVLVALVAKQQVGFVAMASLFQNRILAKILTFLHVLPVVRKQDLIPGEKIDNLETFKQAHKFLKEKNTLVIFPEGASFYEMKLQELKTGVARIALGFEKEEDFEGQLTIIPIVLDYSDSTRFRSSILITLCEPIEISKYKRIFETDDGLAIVQLTEDIRNRLAKHIPQTVNNEQEEMLRFLHIFQAKLIPREVGSLDVEQSLTYRLKLSKYLTEIFNNSPDSYRSLEDNSKKFIELLAKHNLNLESLDADFEPKKENSAHNYAIFYLVGLFPLFAIGLLTHYFPCVLPRLIFQWSKLKIEYKTSVEVVVGIFVFPIFYVLELWLFHQFIATQLWYSLLFLTSLPVLGFFALRYLSALKRFVQFTRYKNLSLEDKSEFLNQKTKLISVLEESKMK